MNQCPHCDTATLVKAGLNPSGSQRSQCKGCRRYTTLQRRPHGYAQEMHTQALRLYLEGNGLRQIGRLLGITHQTVANWIMLAQAQLPATPPQPATSEVIELDELYTFIAKKKNEAFLVTAVDRATRCIVGWAVVPQRTFEVFQAVVDQGVRAKRYFSDGMPLYAEVYYEHAVPQALTDKSQTYSVEGMNAELRHYLARLHRSTRCFSKCIEALRSAVALFVHCWNRQQLHRRAQPAYRKNLIDFVSL